MNLPLNLEEARTAAQAALDVYRLAPAPAGAQTLVVGHTQAMLRVEEHRAVVAIAGTNDLRDMLKDAKIWRHRLGGGVEVHKGFWESYRLLREELIRLCLDRLRYNRRLILTGHSLGAAMVALAVYRDRLALPRNVGVYLFGCPAVGNAAFRRAYALPDTTWRFENNNDAVTWALNGLYDHVGRRIYINRRGQLRPDASALEVAWDRLLGRLRDLGRPGTDGLKDHGMVKYVDALRNPPTPMGAEN